MNSRRPRLTSPLASMRDAVLGVLLRPFLRLSPTAQFVIGFSFLVAVTTLLLVHPLAVGGTSELYKRSLQRVIGLIILIAATYAIAWKFTEHRAGNVPLALSNRRAFALVGSAVVVQTIIMRLGFMFAEGIAIQSTRAPYNDPMVWKFAVPFAAAALLVCLLVDTQLALIGLIGLKWAPQIREPPSIVEISCRFNV